MKFTERMFNYVLKKVFGKLEIKYQNKKINFKTPWKRIEFSQILKRYAKINLEEINKDALAKKARELGISIEKARPKAEIADEIYKKVCRPKIWEPTFIIHHPLGFQPLAKQLKDPRKISQFSISCRGIGAD